MNNFFTHVVNIVTPGGAIAVRVTLQPGDVRDAGGEAAAGAIAFRVTLQHGDAGRDAGGGAATGAIAARVTLQPGDAGRDAGGEAAKGGVLFRASPSCRIFMGGSGCGGQAGSEASCWNSVSGGVLNKL